MCIGSNSVNQAQDLISVTKFEDFPNSLLPNVCLQTCGLFLIYLSAWSLVYKSRGTFLSLVTGIMLNSAY